MHAFCDQSVIVAVFPTLLLICDWLLCFRFIKIPPVLPILCQFKHTKTLNPTFPLVTVDNELLWERGRQRTICMPIQTVRTKSLLKCPFVVNWHSFSFTKNVCHKVNMWNFFWTLLLQIYIDIKPTWSSRPSSFLLPTLHRPKHNLPHLHKSDLLFPIAASRP